MFFYPRLLLIMMVCVPVGIFAERFCWFHFADMFYHGLLWLHSHIGVVFAAYAVLFAAAAIFRLARVYRHFVSLEELCSEPPPNVRQSLERAAYSLAVRSAPKVVYVDVPGLFCFTILGGRVVISRGFLETLEGSELALVAQHEALHLQRKDAARALLWHLLFAALIVPGFEWLEYALYRNRERCVDQLTRVCNPQVYDGLIARFRKAGLYATTPAAPFQATPRVPKTTFSRLFAFFAPSALLMLAALSHVRVVMHLAYLQTHHC